MPERLWTYPELRFITAFQHKFEPVILCAEVNRRFHEGDSIRSPDDVVRILSNKTIFNREKRR
jgi:hypothetical protein